MPLDPQQITPSISLNRVQLIDLPGLTIDPEVKGKTGSGLVSATVLTQLIRQHSDELQLDPSMDDHELRLALDDCFTGEQAIVRTAAENVGRRIGRNMGYLLLALKRGDAINRAARSEWDDSYWTYWGKIKRVWLGGGLVSGRLGPAIEQHALAVFKEAGVDDYAISVSPYASALPSVGAARYAPPDCQTALVFDFGSTMIKCALAAYQDNRLTTLRRLPSYPTEWKKIIQALNDPTHQASHLFSRMISVIANTWHHARNEGLLPASPIMASIAAYVQAGHPLTGAYMQLRRITDNLQLELSRQVSMQLGETIDVRLIHDGTAAATTYAGTKNVAVITVGTA
ncbi:hypothetical protein ACFLXQ_07515, partial [Chloroflexota bacterium]